MVIGFIILGLAAIMFVGILGLMIKSYIKKYINDETQQIEEREIKDYDVKFEKEMWFLTIAAFVTVVVMMFTSLYITVSATNANVTPDTEIVESTPANTTESEDISTTPSESTESEETSTIPTDTTESEETPTVPTTSKVEQFISETTEPALKDQPTYADKHPTIDPDELEMLACVIYQEAGGNRSCDDCRRYVADIVLNRIEHPKFPNTMEGVLTAHGQYGTLYLTGIKWPERAKYETEKEAVERAYRIAEEVLSGQHSKLYGQGYIWQAQFIQGTEGFWCCGHWYGR